MHIQLLKLNFYESRLEVTLAEEEPILILLISLQNTVTMAT